MRAKLSFLENCLESYTTTFLFFIVTCFSYRLKDIDLVFNDAFHTGEYFAAFSYVENNIYNFLVVHGALDYVPAWIAHAIYGQGHFFLATAFIYALLNIVASGLFVLSVELVTRSTQYRYLAPNIAALTSPYLTGYRDIFLTAAIFMFLSMQRDILSRTVSFFKEIVFGIVTFAGFMWAYNRGLSGLFVFALPFVDRAARQRPRWIPAVVALLLFIVCSLSTQLLSGILWLKAIFFLATISNEWGLGWGISQLEVLSFVLLTNGAAFGAMLGAVWKSDNRSVHLQTYMFLGMCCACMLQSSLYRIDTTHAVMGLWLPLLAFVYTASLKGTGPTFGMAVVGSGILVTGLLLCRLSLVRYMPLVALLFLDVKRFRLHVGLQAGARLLVLFVLLFPFAVSASYVLDGLRTNSYVWVKGLVTPPEDTTLVPQGVAWAAQVLNEHRVDSVFDFTNSGAINGLVAKPPVSPFAYVIYADAKHEDMVLRDFMEKKPQAVVFSSDTAFGYQIDGRPMPARYSKLAGYILQNYPAQICQYNYCVRFIP